MNNEELWQAVLAQIQLNISPANFATWFKNTRIFLKKKNNVLISVPNSFAKEWLENKYNKFILKVLRSLDKEIKEIKYEVKPSKTKTEALSSTNLRKIDADAEQLEFQEFKVDPKTNLNSRYLFDNFIIGSFNELAHAAALAISKKPGVVYNPLFIYGGVGIGKTHLLQATGNEIAKHFPKKIVKYFPAEKFISEIVTSIKNRNIDELKLRLRQIDILIVDDIQFLAGKEKTQEEFFHTFNVLYEKNKQIILSSDKPPKTIPSIEERLRSRFEGGMIADIGTPDYETRVAILKRKSQEKNIAFSDKILDYIASNIKTNIRELEGALNKLIAYQRINNNSLALEDIKGLLENLIASPSKITNAKKIIQTVADFYDLKEREIYNPSRKKEIVRPRQIAMYLLRQETKYSYPYIGRKFKRKDHTTAIHAYKKINREMETNAKLLEEITLIRQRIYTV